MKIYCFKLPKVLKPIVKLIFGKSVYYRVGMGIVVFYSKIATDTGYESRLIITLVEDESKIEFI